MTYFLSMKIPKLASFYQTMHSLLFFNYFLRFILESYMEFALFSLLSLTNFNHSNKSEVLSDVASKVILSLIVATPIFICAFSITFQSKLAEERFEKRIGTMYSGLKTETFLPSIFHGVFVFRRLLIAITVVYCQEVAYA